jgi:hypothetical protein
VAKAQADQERVLAETLSQAKQAEAQRDLEVKKAEYLQLVKKQQAQADNVVANVAKRHMAAIESVRKTDKVEVEPPMPLKKPPVSEAQRKLVHARAAEGEPWAKEWASKDKGGKLPEKKAEVDPDRLETGSAEESEEHGLPPGGKKLTGKDIARDHLKEDPKAYAKEEVAAHAAHTYPPGTAYKGRVKVIEPVTGKTSWHSVRSGQKMSGDGHSVSSRLAECPSAATPQNPTPGSGPTQEQRDPTMGASAKAPGKAPGKP